jgi:hypothetical protein
MNPSVHIQIASYLDEDVDDYLYTIIVLVLDENGYVTAWEARSDWFVAGIDKMTHLSAHSYAEETLVHTSIYQKLLD